MTSGRHRATRHHDVTARVATSNGRPRGPALTSAADDRVAARQRLSFLTRLSTRPAGHGNRDDLSPSPTRPTVLATR